MSNSNPKNSQNQSQYNNPTFDEIDKEAADQARFIKPVEGQNLILQFYPNRTEIKEVDFQNDGTMTKRVNFIVTDATGRLERRERDIFWCSNGQENHSLST